MRNFILILILFLTTSSASYSQNIRFGIVAGPAIVSNTKENINIDASNPQKDRTREIQSATSYFAGLVASIPISKSIIFRPQLEYIQKGWKAHIDYRLDSLQDFDRKTKINCLDLPLNFVYNAPTKNGRFFIGAGPYLSYALSGNQTLDDGTSSDISFDTSANRFDIGINVLAGYEFHGGFFVSLNYSHGFIDFLTNLDITANPSNKNTVLGLGIGYMFK